MFSSVAKQCGIIIEQVLEGEISTRAQLDALWPVEADSYDVLEDLWSSIIEYGNPAASGSYRRLLEASARILQEAPDDPKATESRIRAIEAEDA